MPGPNKFIFCLAAALLLLACGDDGGGSSEQPDSGTLVADASAIVDARSVDAMPLADSGPAGCSGEPDPSVETACALLPLGMECSPVQGCKGSGTCLARQSMQDCTLRSLANCGTGIALNNCRVELGTNPPTTSLCVQTDRAALCEAPATGLVTQGACLGYEGGNVCEWDAGANPVCTAQECIGYPISSFCEAIAGCNWN